jgi:hypothetical protein
VADERIEGAGAVGAPLREPMDESRVQEIIQEFNIRASASTFSVATREIAEALERAEREALRPVPGGTPSPLEARAAVWLKQSLLAQPYGEHEDMSAVERCVVRIYGSDSRPVPALVSLIHALAEGCAPSPPQEPAQTAEQFELLGDGSAHTPTPTASPAGPSSRNPSVPNGEEIGHIPFDHIDQETAADPIPVSQEQPMAQTPIENDDIRHRAAGNLGFLLSVIRCGEQLSTDEEACIRKTMTLLSEAARVGPDRPSLPPLRDLFWPPTTPEEEHIYEIRNGHNADYVRAHVDELIALRLAASPASPPSPTEQEQTT